MDGKTISRLALQAYLKNNLLIYVDLLKHVRNWRSMSVEHKLTLLHVDLFSQAKGTRVTGQDRWYNLQGKASSPKLCFCPAGVKTLSSHWRALNILGFVPGIFFTERSTFISCGSLLTGAPWIVPLLAESSIFIFTG